jgi:hypothetical protein
VALRCRTRNVQEICGHEGAVSVGECAHCIINDQIRYVPSKARFVNVVEIHDVGDKENSKQSAEWSRHRSGGQQDMATRPAEAQRKMGKCIFILLSHF